MQGIASKHEIKSKTTLLLFILLSMALTYLVFAPTINIPFYHHDLYKFSTGGHHKPCDQMCGYGFLFNIGRPISAWLDCANFLYAFTFEYIGYSRLLCVFLIGLVMGGMAYYLYAMTTSFWLALFISGSIFFLPCLQTTMIMSATTLIASITLAFTANILVTKGFRTPHRFTQVTFIIFGTCILFLSFFTYPALSSFFLIPTFAYLLWTPWQNWQQIRPLIIFTLFLFGIGSGVYYLAAKQMQQIYMNGVSPHVLGAYHVKLNIDITGRITKLFTLLPQLWNVYYGFWQTLFVYLILSAGISIKAIRFFTSDAAKQNRSIALFQGCQIIATTLIMIILGTSFFLVQPQNVTFSRIIFTFETMIVLLLAWSLLHISTLIPKPFKNTGIILVSGMFFVSAVQANYTVTKSALNDNMEFTYFTSEIANYVVNHKEKLRRIHIITQPYLRHNSFVGLPQKDDIFTGISSDINDDIPYMLNTAFRRLKIRSDYQFHNCIQPDSMSAQEKLVAETKCIHNAPKDQLIITSSHDSKLLIRKPRSVIINMGNLYTLNYKS